MSNYNPNPDNERRLSLDEIEEMEEREKREAKKARFNLFANLNKDGKGVDKDEVDIYNEPTLKNFFKLLGRKLNQLLSVNMLMIFGNFPIFFFLLAMSGYLSIHTTSPYFVTYAPLRGAMLFHNSPAVSALWNLFSRQANVTVLTTADYVLFGLAALALFTFGPVRVGCTYIIRNLFRGEPVFMMSDFFHAIKRNLRQALVYGIVDIALIVLLVYDIFFFYLNYNTNMMMSTMFFMSIVMALLYLIMRQYIYVMLITFDLSILKMFKNGLLFTILGLKRNVVFLVGLVAVAMFEYFLLFAFFPLAVIMPFVILPSLLILMGIYASYPKIREIMIDPFYEKVEAADDGEE